MHPPTADPSASASHATAARRPKATIALNTNSEAILKCACGKGVVSTSETFRDLSLHPQAGMRAKKNLLALSLIEEERITIRRGRGGTAVCIRPTATGYERAHVKRSGTRGGDSIQHEYLARAIQAKIPGATLDVRVGTKAVDVLIAYNTEQHQRLADYLKITPTDSALIAIEVEVSSLDKTAANNIARNAEAGIAHTIISTMTPLRRTPPGAIVVDVFDLLEAL